MRTFEDIGSPPFNSVGLFTYLRTYARRHNQEDPKSTVETWHECVTRVVNATNDQLGAGFTDSEMDELFCLLYKTKCSVAGRFMWQLGTDTVDKAGLMSLQNCAFTVVDNPIEPFVWVMNFLMLGAGCGYRILPSDVEKLPVVKHAKIERHDTNDADFIVPDSREGWVKLLSKVLKAYFYSGKSLKYSCILLRSKGAPIKSFGGLASGPEVLCEGITTVCEIMNKRAGDKLRSVDVLDIMNVIGQIVVSGNVRRSAQIAIGDCNDKDFLRAKRWDLGNIPNYRCYSNNSIVCNDINDIINDDEFWQGYLGNGEPYGLINLDLSRKCGRLGDTQYPDPDVDGYNPCAEQSLSNHETCCLGELYLPNIESLDEMLLCAKYIYRICKHSMTLACPDSKQTEDIVHKNMRMGIGITGYLQATEEQKEWLSPCYEYLRKYDDTYSAENNLPRSIKLTTVKPSGTLSLLAGVTSGVHPGYSQYYIRRVRIASESPLIALAKNHGYDCEYVRLFDDSIDYRTMVISFPYELPAHTVFADTFSAIEQLETVKHMQSVWSDNSVSVTVTYKKEELPDIKEWLRQHYNDSLKSVSFLLHYGHGFKQAPIEPITKDVYDEMVAKTKKIEDVSGICYTAESLALDEENIGDGECVGGVCPVR